MSILKWFSMTKEEKRAAKEKRKQQKDANNEICKIVHSTSPLSDNNYEQIKKLLENGGNLNTEGWAKGYEGVTLLNVAARSGCLKIASLLIDNGADINNASGSLGYTPLMAACLYGHAEIVRLLLVAGADINKKMSFGNDILLPQLQGREFTALAIASLKGNHDIVKLLVGHGARE